MTFTLRPATRIDTPLIIGLAGPTKSGKTYSAHRLAQGLAPNGSIVMLNAEGARGHQYADKFKYIACDIEAPFAYKRYNEAIKQIVKEVQPACIIIDSISHAHDGPGGMLEQHDAEVDRMAGADADHKRKEALNWAGWVKPKSEENEFIYTMLSLRCPVILCFRAKEKIKIIKGKPPIDLGWQPIASDRIAFETIFTLMLPPHSKGVPDLSLSDMREPFEKLVPTDRQIDENLGRLLAHWASGTPTKPITPADIDGTNALIKHAQELTTHRDEPQEDGDPYISVDQIAYIETLLQDNHVSIAVFKKAANVDSIANIRASRYEAAKRWIERSKIPESLRR